MSTRLEARNVAIAGRLAPCDLALVAGELTMLVGPNGAGKTSLLHALAGIGATQGTVSVDGEPLANVGRARRREMLSYLGASRDMKWSLLARDYVALGLSGENREERAEAALDALHASAFADRRLDRLSTGERSRILLARAIAPAASVLLLDEPCANLDPKWQLHVIAQLKAEAERDRAVLLSIHDLGLASTHADRVIVIQDGRIVADGPPETALSRSMIEKVFGVGRDARGEWHLA